MGVLNVTPDSFFDGGRYLTPGRRRSAGWTSCSPKGPRSWTSAASRRGPARKKCPRSEQIRRIEPAVRHAVRARPRRGLGGHHAARSRRSDACARRARRKRRILSIGPGARPRDGSARSSADRHALARSDEQDGRILAIPRGRLRRRRGRRPRASGARHESARWKMACPPNASGSIPGSALPRTRGSRSRSCERLREFSDEGVPVVFGPSRKSFIAAVDDAPAERRLGGTIAACLLAVERGARVLRVHDVAAKCVRRSAVARAATSQPNRGGRRMIEAIRQYLDHRGALGTGARSARRLDRLLRRLPRAARAARHARDAGRHRAGRGVRALHRGAAAPAGHACSPSSAR